MSRAAPVEQLIIGGGIGGLSTALAIARCGQSVRVLEQAAELSEIGYGIQLGPNATRILDGFGLLEKLLPLAVAPRELLYMDALSGERITSIDLGERFLERYGHPYVVVHRGDLQRVLIDACRAEAGVELLTGQEAVALEERAEAVEVRCADGACHTARIVVAADGLHSLARGLVDPREPRTEGFVAYRGTIPIAGLTPRAAMDAMVMWVAPDVHVVQYKVRGGELYNQVAAFRSRRFVAGEGEWGSPEELDERFASLCEPVRVAASQLDRGRRYPIVDRDPISRWGRGRIALLGDAAHPMLPVLAQGGCQAIEDAVAIARAISRAGAGPAALQGYADERAPRANRVQMTARRFAEVCHVGGIGVELRNALFAQHDPRDYRPLDWLYDAAAAGAGASI